MCHIDGAQVLVIVRVRCVPRERPKIGSKKRSKVDSVRSQTADAMENGSMRRIKVRSAIRHAPCSFPLSAFLLVQLQSLAPTYLVSLSAVVQPWGCDCLISAPASACEPTLECSSLSSSMIRRAEQTWADRATRGCRPFQHPKQRLH